MGTQEAFERALEALARKERTSAELTAWLAERGFGADEVDAALARLIEAGAIDDERFARRFAEDKRELRGWGPERIRGALAERGLAPALIDAARSGARLPGAARLRLRPRLRRGQGRRAPRRLRGRRGALTSLSAA